MPQSVLDIDVDVVAAVADILAVRIGMIMTGQQLLCHPHPRQFEYYIFLPMSLHHASFFHEHNNYYYCDDDHATTKKDGMLLVVMVVVAVVVVVVVVSLKNVPTIDIAISIAPFVWVEHY
jgi:hypothetical protein